MVGNCTFIIWLLLNPFSDIVWMHWIYHLLVKQLYDVYYSLVWLTYLIGASFPIYLNFNLYSRGCVADGYNVLICLQTYEEYLEAHTQATRRLHITVSIWYLLFIISYEFFCARNYSCGSYSELFQFDEFL